MPSIFLHVCQVLRRAGIKVTVTSIEANREALKCAQDTVIVPDISINELSTDDKYDVVVVPGGEKGSEAMAKNLAVGNLLQQHYEKGKLVAAICAGKVKIDPLFFAFDRFLQVQQYFKHIKSALKMLRLLPIQNVRTI